jgi:MFS transporter, ACS family, solute carrier family 17 (sodium-dependent inorganic phosphate cotransporter), other
MFSFCQVLSDSKIYTICLLMEPRHFVVLNCVLIVFLGYVDRVSLSVSIIHFSERHGWSKLVQGHILSSFYVGYILTNLLGGVMSKKFGAQSVLSTSILGWSFCTLATPLCAELGATELALCRFFDLSPFNAPDLSLA